MISFPANTDIFVVHTPVSFACGIDGMACGLMGKDFYCVQKDCQKAILNIGLLIKKNVLHNFHFLVRRLYFPVVIF